MWLYYLCNRNKWYETQIFHGGSKFHSVQWSLNSWPFAGKSGTGQCTHCRGGAESVLTLSPTVIGVGLHRLGLKSNFGQVFNWTEIGLHWSCTRWSTTDSNQVHRGQIEVQRGEAELDFNLAEMDLTEVARGGPALTPLKATESKSKFNEAQPSWTWTWTRWPWAEVARGAAQVHWGQVHRGQVEVQRGEAELNFNLAEMDLASMYLCSSECNFSAMLTSWEASTPRRSRGVLVLPTSQHCRGVCGGSPSATPMQILRDGRQVHRGEAEVYLPFLRVKFAPSRWSPTPITVELNVSILSAPPLQWVHGPVPPPRCSPCCSWSRWWRRCSSGWSAGWSWSWWWLTWRGGQQDPQTAVKFKQVLNFTFLVLNFTFYRWTSLFYCWTYFKKLKKTIELHRRKCTKVEIRKEYLTMWNTQEIFGKNILRCEILRQGWVNATDSRGDRRPVAKSCRMISIAHVRT